jgi:hypothetical protein
MAIAQTYFRQPRRLDRRELFAHVLGLGAVALARTAQADHTEPAATHNMLIVGGRSIFLSHLPMFHKLDEAGARFLSPHRFQVLLEAAFFRDGRQVDDLYFRDRELHPGERIYTMQPAEFVLPDLISSGGATPPGSFSATAFRGHLERGGTPVDGLQGISVQIRKVIRFSEFNPRAGRPTALEYILFGRGPDLFAAHRISKPPDFDQIIPVSVTGAGFSEEQLSRGIRTVIRQRPNRAGSRLRTGQEALAHVPEAISAPVRLTAGREIYFEEGELLIPPQFNSTVEEKQSGF